MHAHAALPQEAWTYDAETLSIYRDALLLYERLIPYVRADRGDDRALWAAGHPPACLTEPGDDRGWVIADAYGYLPALWVAPVLEHGVRKRELLLRLGDWIDF
jgi:alpha-D-xyloside xylohydrolase